MRRRRFLAGLGSAAAVGLAGCSNDAADVDGQGEPVEEQTNWKPDGSPTSLSLFDVTTTRTGPYAVGDGGTVVGHCDIGWALVLDKGPANDANPLYGCDVTDDGVALWFAGGSGGLGRLDVTTQTVEDFSAPKEKTSTWEAIAVHGVSGREHIYALNGSGELLHGRYGVSGQKQAKDAGDDENESDKDPTEREHVYDGPVRWDAVKKPGTGTTGEAVAFADNGFGYLTDSGGEVIKTVGNREWQQIGITGTGEALTDVSPFEREQAVITGGSGAIYRYNGFDWTRVQVGSEALQAVERGPQNGFAVGETGVIYELTPDGWKQARFAASKALHGVTMGTPEYDPVAVGEDGTLIRRVRR